MIELLLVAVVLSILVSTVVRGLVGTTQDSRAAAAAASVQAVQRSIDRHHAIHGEYPDNLDSAWFQAFKLPESPYLPPADDGAVSNVQDIESKIYPTWKSDKRHNNPFWYNKANGYVRSRVAYQGNDEETLALFNRVNGTNATDWDQQTR